jgi:predicted DNA-binding protein
MKRTALFLRDDQMQKLTERSAETGAPVAELIRRAIDAYLKIKKETK